MIDMHCHILPGVDDGPAILPESIAMARQAVSDGIRMVVATPHALGGAHFNPPQKILQDVKDFQNALQARDIPLVVIPGCEVHHCPNMANRIAAGEATFLNTAKTHILVEFPFQTLSEVFTGELAKLIAMGITPVLAHPERNPVTWHHPEILFDCISMGCLIQINGTSITGGFGNGILENANQLLRHRMVHVIASDAHSSGQRCPALSLAVEFAGKVLDNPSEALAMVNETPRRILDGKPISVAKAILPKGKKSRGLIRRG